MQPQDAGGGFDWAHAFSAMGGAIVGGVASLIGWIYRSGGKEPALRADIKQTVTDAEKRVETKVDEVERHMETKLEELVKHFTDVFAAMREQMNLNQRQADRDFVRKDEFGEWRKEWREDKKRIFEKLDDLLSRRP